MSIDNSGYLNEISSSNPINTFAPRADTQQVLAVEFDTEVKDWWIEGGRLGIPKEYRQYFPRPGDPIVLIDYEGRMYRSKMHNLWQGVDVRSDRRDQAILQEPSNNYAWHEAPCESNRKKYCSGHAGRKTRQTDNGSDVTGNWIASKRGQQSADPRIIFSSSISYECILNIEIITESGDKCQNMRS